MKNFSFPPLESVDDLLAHLYSPAVQAILEAFPGMVTIQDSFGRFWCCNTLSCQRYLGENSVGKNFPLELSADSVPEIIRQRLAEADSAGSCQPRDIIVCHRQGSTWCRNVVNPVKNAAGERLAFISMSVDLHDMQAMQQELEARDNLLQGTSQAAQLLLSGEKDFDAAVSEVLALLGELSGVDRVYVWNIHKSPTNPDDAALYTTQLYEWSLGAEPQQDTEICTNCPMSDVIPNWISAFLEGRCVNSLVRDMSQAEQDQLTPQGIISIMTAPIMFHGQLWGFIGFDDCHSERTWSAPEENILRAAGTLIGTAIHNNRINNALRESEQQLRELAEAAKAANVAKGDFLANMSHEIRTPMNAIIGFTGIALEGTLTPRQRGLLEKIDTAGKALLRIINDILDFSKIEAGKLEVEHLDFYVEDVVLSVSDLVANRAHQKGLELLLDIDPALPKILGDPLRLNQILTNLATNAIKFTEKGEVKIRARLAEKDENCPDVEWEEGRVLINFSIEDTGIGMSEEVISRLFTPFTQADTSTTRKYGGTGLGLALCRQLVTLMGGGIGCRSVAGQGTCFYFSIPFETVRGQERAGRWPASFEDMRVLVVDDNPGAIDIMREILRAMGCRFIKTALSGEDAVALVDMCKHDAAFDLVLMDWKMPGMDGIQTTRKIREVFSGKLPPVVIMTTAYDREDLYTSARQEDIPLVLIKPVTQSALYDAVAEAFSGKITRAPEKSEMESMMDLVKDFSGARVLLVEDNDLNQMVAEDLLSQAGFRVCIANNGVESLKLLEDEAFDLVLMDIQMPEMDGLTATRLIREQPKFARLPIIAMTAHAMNGDTEKSLAAGMNDHVTKPINIKEFFTAIARHMRPGFNVAVLSGPHGLASEDAALLDINRVLPPALEGFNLKAGLQNCSNNAALYRRLLIKSHKDMPDYVHQIYNALRLGSIKDAGRIAHTMQGLWRTLGAEKGWREAIKLEQAVYNAETMETLMKLARNLDEVTADLVLSLRNLMV